MKKQRNWYCLILSIIWVSFVILAWTTNTHPVVFISIRIATGLVIIMAFLSIWLLQTRVKVEKKLESALFAGVGTLILTVNMGWSVLDERNSWPDIPISIGLYIIFFGLPIFLIFYTVLSLTSNK